ncbi:MAG: hypothetical protein KC620_17465, partial [Myxococcales bacterium]|nr:hypothetical protein [Myxococcales bacterium]
AVLAERDMQMHVPRPRWCTDNAAMIAGAAAAAAAERAGHGHLAADRRLNAVASWRLHRA